MAKKENKMSARADEIERMAEESMRRALLEAGNSQEDVDSLFYEEGENLEQEEGELGDGEESQASGDDEPKNEEHSEEEKKDSDLDISGKKLKAKVDGVEEEVSIETLLRSYQINKAADKRMQEAAAKERELEERAMKLLELQGSLLSGERGKAAAAEEEAAKQKKEERLVEDDSVREAIASIFSGDEEASAKKLMDAIDAKVRAETERRMADERKNLEKLAEDRIRKAAPEIQTQMMWDSAVSDYVSSNKDMFEDPVLANLWKTNLENLAEQGLSPRQATEKAGESVRNWLGKYAPKQSDDGRNEDEQRREQEDEGIRSRKERKDASKKYDAGSVVSKKSQRGATDDDDTPMSVSDYVKQARKMRGQA